MQDERLRWLVDNWDALDERARQLIYDMATFQLECVEDEIEEKRRELKIV